jgi:hypothetical protein
MSSLLMYRAIPLAAVTNQFSTGTTNLLTPDPKEVCSLNGGAGVYSFDIDAGAAVTIDSFFAGFFGVAGPYVGGVWTGTGMGTGLVEQGIIYPWAALHSEQGNRRTHGFQRIVAPATSRYWQIKLAAPASTTLGVLGLGRALQPFYGREWGSGRSVRDMSDVTELRGGGFGIDRGARVPGLQFTLGDLSDAELVKAWDIVEEVGGSAPIVVCEDPDRTNGLNERFHWGLFDRPEAYERAGTFQNRWSFRVKGWN